MSVDDIAESITVAGPRLTLTERPIPGGTLRAATFEGGPSTWPPRPTRSPGRSAPSGPSGTTSPAPTSSPWSRSSATGPAAPAAARGRGDGFVLYATPGALDGTGRTIGHEHTHTWIPARIGEVPEDQPQAAARFWLTEGFTDFFTDRTLLRGGLSTVDETVGPHGRAMKAYDASPGPHRPQQPASSPTSGPTARSSSCPTSAAHCWR
jgi:hypothetical protein